jgi:hypothetical protein
MHAKTRWALRMLEQPGEELARLWAQELAPIFSLTVEPGSPQGEADEKGGDGEREGSRREPDLLIERCYIGHWVRLYGPGQPRLRLRWIAASGLGEKE